jgi:hypothetical protein
MDMRRSRFIEEQIIAKGDRAFATFVAHTSMADWKM